MLIKMAKPSTVEKVISVLHKEVINYGSLGKEVKISPKSNISYNKAGYKIEYFVPTIEVLIGIGKDNTARLLMSVDDWEALKKGKPIDITTTKKFKKDFL